MTTLPEWWTAPYPEVASVQAAAAYLDALGGNINRGRDNGSFVLNTGGQELARGDSDAELDSFLLGFALAHLICERHGPIARPATPPVVAAVTAPAEVEAADAPAEFAPPEPEIATAAALASADAVPDADDEAEPERAPLSLVTDSDDEDEGDEGDEDDDADAAPRSCRARAAVEAAVEVAAGGGVAVSPG